MLLDETANLGAVPACRSLINGIILSPKVGGRGVDVEVVGSQSAIVALATGKPVPDEVTAKLERVKGIGRYRQLVTGKA